MTGVRQGDARDEAEIAFSLVACVASGEIGPGERIPPIAMAAAASNAGFSAGAARWAAGQLVAADVLRFMRGDGYYVGDDAAREGGAAKAGSR